MMAQAITHRKVVGLFVVGALIGLGTFALLVWRAVTIEDLERAEAMRRFDIVRSGFRGQVPLIELDQQGRAARLPPAEGSGRAVRRLKALAWRAAEHRLVSSDAPFWFFKVKGPAARFALEGTGVDLERLHLTPSELERAGPALIVDHTRQDGSRLLVWTE